MPNHGHARQSDGPGELPDARAITMRFARGDRDAFAVFYERTFDDALADARRLTGKDEHFCLDAVQDAYLRAAKKLPAMDSWGACRTWLRTAIASSAVDRLRADAARSRRERRRATAGLTTTEPRLSAEDNENVTTFVRLMAKLDERQQDAIYQHIARGRSLRVVGQAMNLSRDAVHGLVRRGLATLSAEKPTTMEGATDDHG